MKRVDQDVTRFRKIVRGEIRKNLKRFVSQGELVARQGGRTVKVPLPQINLPRFTFGDRGGSGVGQGEGDPGDAVSGPGEAGEQPGEHELEAEVSLEELAQILGEELELPRIQPRGKLDVEADINRYRSIRRSGPQSLRHFKRTFLRSLQREIMTGTYDGKSPNIVPRPEDFRYRSYETARVPESSASILYMMDVSGSMGSEQKEIVRNTAFWLDTWIRSQYRNVVVRYIVHDAAAREVNRHDFFHLKESGGTKISSAYNLVNQVIDKDYPPDQWNIYCFQFSDGDNWSGGDTAECLRLLDEQLLPKSNLFCYGQVKSAYGSGQYKNDLDRRFDESEVLITQDIPDRDGILPCIREFLKRGR
jgi:uncharacterized sporulation protein YeaH/YhbH (DUF444 family)